MKLSAKSVITFSFFISTFLYYSQESKLDSLLNAFKKTKADSVKINCLNEFVKLVFLIESADSTYLGKANKMANELLEASLKNGSSKGEANARIQIGNIYFKKNNFIGAFEQYQKGLSIAEKTNDNELKANFNNKIGFIHNFIMKDPHNAKPYFETAYNYYKSINNKRSMAKTMVNLSVVYSDINQIDKAIEMNLTAYKQFKELDDQQGLAIVSGNLGDYYIKRGQYDKAMKFIELSFSIHEKRGSKLGINYNYLRLGVVHYHLKEYKMAESYLLKTYEFATNIRHNDLILSSAKYLNLLYTDIKKPDKAIFFQNKYYVAKDSLNSSEKIAKIAAVETKNSLERFEAKKQMEMKLAAVENEKEQQKKNYILIGIAIVLMIVLFFSVALFKRLKISREQNEIIQNQKKEVEEKNELIEEKQKEILDSIHYAKRIQTTLLAHEDFIDENLPENFVLFKPKDIVSGDFYWATKKDHLFYLAVCDSTGNGVPGAFMSLLSISFLSEAINEKHILKPNEVFNYVRRKLIENISRDGQQDGFDGILICLDTLTKKVTYCAANNAPLLVSNGSYAELESDRMPVGKGIRNEDFREFTIKYQKNDRLYLYTDGYADQFGGPKGKKFMYKKLNELLVNVSGKQLEQQCIELDQTLETWRGNLEQVDDVCIIGLCL
ncbi:MAG: SpoIIE family protein phosphatase [Sphingobacteriaceae bacterium]